MAAPAPSRWKRRCLRCLRICRITGLLVVIALLAGLGYVNELGLPEFVKRPLLDKLRAQGLELSFTRVRWRFYRGIVAENVQFGRVRGGGGEPRFSAREVQIKLNHDALRHLKFEMDALVLTGG